MISRREFLEYQLKVEKRFSEQEMKILKLKHDLEKAELRAQIKSPAPIAISDEEKTRAQEDAAKQQKVFDEWTEDSQTLAKLGIGNNNE